MGWACGTYGWEERAYRVLVGKLEGRRPLGRPRHRWVDNIRMDLQEVGCGYMEWIGLAQDRDRWRTLVSAVMNHRVPWKYISHNSTLKLCSYYLMFTAAQIKRYVKIKKKYILKLHINLLNLTSHVMHQQFNIQQLYALPTLYLCVLYLSENKQQLVPLTA